MVISKIYKSKTWCLLALVGYASLVMAEESPQATTAVDKPVEISVIERMKAKDYFTDLAMKVVEGEFRSQGLNREKVPSLMVKIGFDEKRYQDDYLSALSRIAEARKQAVADLTTSATQTSSKPQSAPVANQPLRFGRLNIDVSSQELKTLLDRPWTPDAGSGVAVTVQVPVSDMKGDALRQLDAMSYVNKLELVLSLSQDVPEQIEELLKTVLVASLDLSKINGGQNKEQWITVNRVAAPSKPGFKDWIQGVWQPQNNMLAIVAVGLIIGLVLLLSALLMAKVFRSIATGIKELKPVPAATGATSGAGAANDHVESAPHSEEEASDDGHATAENGSRVKPDTYAVAKALTSEMRTIRDQLRDVIIKENQLCTEQLRDLFYDAHGLDDFRDLLSFAGYDCLKPAMDRLPRSCVEDLQGFIEDHRSIPSNILHGVEVATRLYRDCISKITTADDSNKAMSDLRAKLVLTDDDPLEKIAANATPEEVSVLLKSLTVERGNRIIRSVSPEVLKDACRNLDKNLTELAPAIVLLLQKLDQPTTAEKPKSQVQKRFILRLVRNAGLRDEVGANRLVDDDDWVMRRAMIETKLFFVDLPFVPERVLKSAIGSLPLSSRAEVLHVSDEALRKQILGFYSEGSKQQQMLASEFGDLQKNAKRAEEVMRRKNKVIEELMGIVRRQIAADPMVVDLILRSRAEKLGVAIPDHLPGKDANMESDMAAQRQKDQSSASDPVPDDSSQSVESSAA